MIAVTFPNPDRITKLYNRAVAWATLFEREHRACLTVKPEFRICDRMQQHSRLYIVIESKSRKLYISTATDDAFEKDMLWAESRFTLDVLFIESIQVHLEPGQDLETVELKHWEELYTRLGAHIATMKAPT